MRRQIFLGPSAILRKKINVKRRVEQRCSLYSFAPTLERARRRGKKTFQGHWLFESLSYALCRCVVTYLLCEKGNKGLWVDGWVSGWTEWDENMNSSSTTGRIDILFFWNPTVNIINPTRNIRIFINNFEGKNEISSPIIAGPGLTIPGPDALFFCLGRVFKPGTSLGTRDLYF